MLGPYLYVREIARVNGKPKVISQTYDSAKCRSELIINLQQSHITQRARLPEPSRGV